MNNSKTLIWMDHPTSPHHQQDYRRTTQRKEYDLMSMPRTRQSTVWAKEKPKPPRPSAWPSPVHPRAQREMRTSFIAPRRGGFRSRPKQQSWMSSTLLLAVLLGVLVAVLVLVVLVVLMALLRVPAGFSLLIRSRSQRRAAVTPPVNPPVTPPASLATVRKALKANYHHNRNRRYLHNRSRIRNRKRHH